MMISRASTIALFGCLAVLVGPALAETVDVQALKDNTLYDDFKGLTSNGMGEHFFVGTTASNVPRRGLIAFDVAAMVPAGATIDAVTLTLNNSRSIGPTADVTVHPVLADWGEGISDAPGQEGAGTLAEAGDATWLHRFFDTEFWDNAGGDFVELPSATTAVSGIAVYTWSGAGLVADVQSWLDAPKGNYGWLLLGDEAVLASAKRFDTHENANPSVRPVLTVEYTIGSECLGDVDASGEVDFADLLAVLSAWGGSGGPEDLDGSGTVDFGDLLIVLGNWGPCA